MKKIFILVLLIEILSAEFYAKSIKVEKVKISQERRYYGKIALNEESISVFNLRVDGFVEDIKVANSYQKIEKGSELFSIYSPELLQAQNEYINALKYKSNIVATKEKLLLLGVDERLIKKIEKEKKPLKVVPFFSKNQGLVYEKNISEGQYIKKGESIYKIVDLSSVWFIAQIPQEEFAFLSKPLNSSIEILGIKQKFQAQFLQIIPTINPSSKLLEARFLLKNPNLELFENLFGIITLSHPSKEVLFVPKECVLLRDNKLYVFKKDEEGKFAPQEIEALSLNAGYEIISGLESGDEIAQNALFILDSDAQANGEYE